MKESTMAKGDPPQFTFGNRVLRITVTGTEAIRAAGWTLKLLVVAASFQRVAWSAAAVAVILNMEHGTIRNVLASLNWLSK
jgi:hypothetical protein